MANRKPKAMECADDSARNWKPHVAICQKSLVAGEETFWRILCALVIPRDSEYDPTQNLAEIPKNRKEFGRDLARDSKLNRRIHRPLRDRDDRQRSDRTIKSFVVRIFRVFLGLEFFFWNNPLMGGRIIRG